MTPVHLALGLLADQESLAVALIEASGIEYQSLGDELREALPPRAPEVPDLVPYDAGARKALELTFRQALRLGHGYIGTEHILLALLEVEHGEGPLTDAGLDVSDLEPRLVALLAGMTPQS